MKTSRDITDTDFTSDCKSDDGSEDNYCDLDPTKICDNCFKCLETDTDYASVEIDGIYLNGERIY